jgi:hypothetical protein
LINTQPLRSFQQIFVGWVSRLSNSGRHFYRGQPSSAQAVRGEAAQIRRDETPQASKGDTSSNRVSCSS